MSSLFYLDWFLLGFFVGLGLISAVMAAVDLLLQQVNYVSVNDASANCTPTANISLTVSISLFILGVCGLISWWTPLIVTQAVTVVISIVGLVLFIRKLSNARLVSWILTAPFIVWAILFFGVEVSPPGELPDGPYVNKSWTLAAKTQYLLDDLPCDNVLPYLVSEFIVRGLSFKDNNPILPNQPVTNRGILASLVIAPVLSLAPFERPLLDSKLPMMTYYGSWPNAYVLYSDLRYSVFLGSYLAIAGCLFASILRYIVEVWSTKAAIFFAVVILSNTFILSQLVFTWPKILCGLLLVLSIQALFTTERGKISNIIIALLAASLAPHFHPVGYFCLVILAILLCLKVIWDRIRLRWSQLDMVNLAGAILVLAILASIIWFNYFSPLTSNLFVQNNVPGAERLSKYDWLMMRMQNIGSALPISIETKTFQLGWMWMLPVAGIAALPLLWRRPLVLVALVPVYLVSLALVAIPFSSSAPLVILGMQFVVPFGLWASTLYLRGWEVCLVVFAQLGIFYMSQDHLLTSGRLTGGAVLQLQLSIIIMCLLCMGYGLRHEMNQSRLRRI